MLELWTFQVILKYADPSFYSPFSYLADMDYTLTFFPSFSRILSRTDSTMALIVLTTRSTEEGQKASEWNLDSFKLVGF